MALFGLSIEFKPRGDTLEIVQSISLFEILSVVGLSLWQHWALVR